MRKARVKAILTALTAVLGRTPTRGEHRRAKKEWTRLVRRQAAGGTNANEVARASGLFLRGGMSVRRARTTTLPRLGGAYR
jgi:hypothetical protein